MAQDYSKKAGSNFIWRFLERCGAQGVTLIVSIVLARKLDPEQFGVITLITVFTSILSVFIDSGLGSSLIQKKDSDIYDFSTVFWFNIISCTVLYFLLFFAAPYIALFYENPELTPYVRVLGITVLISGVKNIQQSYVSKHLLFRKFFVATLAGTILAGVVGIVMAYYGFGVWALVAQHLVNLFVDTVILWIVVRFRPAFYFSWSRFKKLFGFGWKLLVSSLLDTVYTELRTLIIGKKYSSADMAYYKKGDQFPQILVTNVNTAINSTIFPLMSQRQDDVQAVKSITKRVIKVSTFVLVPCAVGLAACSRNIIGLVLTDKWLPAVPYMMIFCLTYGMYPLATANLNAIKALGRSDYFLILETVKKVIGLTAILISMWFGVFWIAVSCIVTSLFSFIVNAWPNRKLIHYPIFEQIRDFGPAWLLSAAMGACVYAVNFFGFSYAVTLAIQIPLGVIIYVAGAMLFRFESFRFCVDFVKNVFVKKKARKE